MNPPSTQSPILTVHGIHKSYLGKRILDDISLSIQPGTFYVLLGRNGVGKSTLMRILMRHEAPDSGNGVAFGLPMSGNDQSMNEHIGYVSEAIEYGVNDSIEGFFRKYGRFYPRWNSDLFTSFIRRFGIDPKRNHAELSRGQKMQVAFSAAIAIQPRLLFLDEITSVLDASARSHVMGYLSEFCRQGGSVVMATNIVSEIEHQAAHLWLLEKQRIQINLPMKEVKTHYLKLRKQDQTTNPVFQNPACIPVAINSDGSTSYVLPKESVDEASMEESLLDRREVTSEELFIFFTRKEGVSHL